MNEKVKRKLDPNAPVSLLIHGSNSLSFDLCKTLINQGGRVIIVDNFNSKSRKLITELKAVGQADFIDFKGLDDILKTLPHLDYIFYFLHDYLISTDKFSSKEFLDETNRINSILKASKKYGSKLALITTIKLNQDLSAHVLNSNLSAPLPYSPVELQKYAETLTAEGRDQYKINARILRVGTLLGKDIDLLFDKTVSDLITDGSKVGNLNIYGEGLDVHYLIHQSDAIYGILKLTFSNKTEGEVISLTNNHDYTTLSLAYKLLELNPEIAQIKFHPFNDKTSVIFDQYIPAPNATNYGWAQKVTLEQALAETISTLYPEKGQKILDAPNRISEEENQAEIVKRSVTRNTFVGNVVEILFSPFTRSARGIINWLKREKEKLNLSRTVLFAVITITLLSFFYFILSPIVGVGLSSLLLYSNTKKAVEMTSNFDFTSASEYLKKASKNVTQNEKYLIRIKWIFTTFNKSKLYDNSSQLLFASDYALSGATSLTRSLQPLATYAKEFKPSLDFSNTLPSSSREYRIYLKELQENLKGGDRASYNLRIASQLLSTVDLSVFPKLLQKPLSEIKMSNERIINQIEPAQKVLSFVPELLGVDERKRYLILLQNPGELRATGGWLSSYAVIAVEGGQIRELKVDDIYNAEGQLKVAQKLFNAPQDMQKALKLTRWSMSLSNWYPNFPDSAKNSTYFLSQLDPGTDFDGVIAFDTEVIMKLLDKWGGLQIPGESVTITSQNLNEKIFKLHSEFVPGESLKSTFLANLANETLKKIFSSDFSGMSEIAQAITSSLSEKHLLVYLNDSEANNFFTNSGWSGEIDSRYQWAPIPVEWNWGANKANLYLERNNSLLINITDEKNIDYEFSTFLQNKSTNNIYPQGDYINYYRVYLPLNASIVSTKGFLNNQFSTYKENGFLVVGGWLNVPIKSTKSFTLKYSISKTENYTRFPIIDDGTDKSLSLEIYKQPGTYKDIYDLSIIYPDTWSVSSHEGLSRAVNTLTTRFNQITDTKFDIFWKLK